MWNFKYGYIHRHNLIYFIIYIIIPPLTPIPLKIYTVSVHKYFDKHVFFQRPPHISFKKNLNLNSIPSCIFTKISRWNAIIIINVFL